MTAIEWLDEKLQDTMSFQYGSIDGVRKVIIPLEDYMKLKQEAIELEKEQIIDAQSYAISNADMTNNRGYFDCDKYYNETYGSKGSETKTDKI